MCRSSLWNFLVCDMYYILYMLDFSYPFLLKITIAILLNSLGPAAFALSGWLYVTRYTDLLQSPTISAILLFLVKIKLNVQIYLLKVCNFTTTKNYQNLAQKITSKFY